MTDEPKDLQAIRRTKLAALRGMGIDPYPARSRRNHLARDVVDQYREPEGDHVSEEVAVAGRITALRPHGKATFADLTDASGRIQVYFKKDAVGDDAYAAVELLDLGDFAGVEGTVFKTRTGEVTIAVGRWQLLAKGLRTPPIVKTETTDAGIVIHDGFADPEKRYRKRYLDMLVNADSRRRVLARARITATARRFMESRGFIEIETPILQPLYGGANARPFVTHHHVLDADLYLRIADELYLKRCLVAGMEKVFEIGKDFRNEGIDRIHYPEFTMLEAYEAFGDYETMMTLVEGLILAVANELAEALVVTYQGKPLSFAPPWPRLPLIPALNERLGLDVMQAAEDDLRAKAAEFAAAAGKHADLATASRGKLIDELFDLAVVPTLWEPTFVTDYPAELSPLAKRRRDDDRYAERFELFITSVEIANAFSEQNDPAVQREAFEAQVRARAQGDDESHPVDEDFLEALEYGMPPAGGLGVGLDRLAMVLTDAPNIREVIAFPQLKAKKQL